MQIYESTNIYWYVCAIFWLITRLDMMWNTQTGRKVKRAVWQISQGALWRLSAVIVATLRGLCVTDCCSSVGTFCLEFTEDDAIDTNHEVSWSSLGENTWASEWGHRIIDSFWAWREANKSGAAQCSGMCEDKRANSRPAGVLSFETGGVKIKCCSVSVLTQRIEIGWISVRQVNVWALQRSQELMQMSHSKINKFLVYFVRLI